MDDVERQMDPWTQSQLARGRAELDQMDRAARQERLINRAWWIGTAAFFGTFGVLMLLPRGWVSGEGALTLAVGAAGWSAFFVIKFNEPPVVIYESLLEPPLAPNGEERTSSPQFLTVLGPMISAELRPTYNPKVLRALIEAGNQKGYPMKEVYEERRQRAKAARNVEAPSYEELVGHKT